MQQPTCTDIRIRSAADAQRIFYAVHQGLLEMLHRRLDANERQALRSGGVYVWEEHNQHTKLTSLKFERFTDGRKWTDSHVRDEFLFYYEKFVPQQSDKPLSNTKKSLPPSDWDQLIKQTYSAWIESEGGHQKWHMTAYFSLNTLDDLKTVDDDPLLQHLNVPVGLFQSAREIKPRTQAAASVETIGSVIVVPPVPPSVHQTEQAGQSLAPVLMLHPYPGGQLEIAASQEPIPSQPGSNERKYPQLLGVQSPDVTDDSAISPGKQSYHASNSVVVATPHVLTSSKNLQPHFTSSIPLSSLPHLSDMSSSSRYCSDTDWEFLDTHAYYQNLEMSIVSPLSSFSGSLRSTEPLPVHHPTSYPDS